MSVLPAQSADSTAALAAMLQAVQGNALLLQVQGSHHLGTRLEEGWLAALEAVLATLEARIRQPKDFTEAWAWPGHLPLQLGQRGGIKVDGLGDT